MEKLKHSLHMAQNTPWRCPITRVETCWRIINNKCCAASWYWTFVKCQKVAYERSRCFLWSEQKSGDSLYGTWQFCGKKVEFLCWWSSLRAYIGGAAWINTCFVCVGPVGSFVWSWGGKLRYLFHNCHLYSMVVIVLRQTGGQEWRTTASMFAVTTVIILSYMTCKNLTQYFDEIVCIDKHNRKAMMEI